MYGGFCQAAEKSGRNNEVAVRRGFTVADTLSYSHHLSAGQCIDIYKEKLHVDHFWELMGWKTLI